MLLLKNGTVITGDGKTVIEHGNVLVDINKIVAVTDTLDVDTLPAGTEVVDCSGKAIMPGLITHHTHGVVNGPFIAGAGPRIGNERVLDQHIRHLKNGHTTAMSVDGFCSMEDVRESQKLSPLRLKQTTAHLPAAFKAALTVDGKGLSYAHKQLTVEKQLADGALAIGEVGSGQLCAGGDYLYIPAMVEAQTGYFPNTAQSMALLYEVLGKYADKNYYDRDRVAKMLKAQELDHLLTPEQARDIVWTCTFKVFDLALASYEEAALYAIRYDVPVLPHHTPSTMAKVLEMAKMGVQRLIVCHTCLGYDIEETLRVNRELKERYGTILDVAVLDAFSDRIIEPNQESIFAMFEHKLIDVLSTDYSGGKSCSMLLCIDEVVRRGYATLPEAVAYATTNVTKAIPGIAPGLGLLARGYFADILVTEYPNVGKLNQVYVDGKLVVNDGEYLGRSY